MNNYWHIELYGGEIIKVTPDNAGKIEAIQKMIADQQGAITTPTRSIVVKDIKDFRLSDETIVDQKLIEAANAAFDEPTINPDESIQARWIKRSVPRRMWEKHYRHIPAYRMLEENTSFVIMCFKLPVHQIDHNLHQELTPDEQLKMSKNNA